MDEADFDSIDPIAENSGRRPSARPSLAEFWEHALQALKRAVREERSSPDGGPERLVGRPTGGSRGSAAKVAEAFSSEQPPNFRARACLYDRWRHQSVGSGTG